MLKAYNIPNTRTYIGKGVEVFVVLIGGVVEVLVGGVEVESPMKAEKGSTRGVFATGWILTSPNLFIVSFLFWFCLAKLLPARFIL